MAPRKRTVEVKDLDGKVQELSTADIERIVPYCPYIYPDRRCATVGSAIYLKKGWIRTLETVKEIEAKVSEVKGRVRGKNQEAETESEEPKSEG